MRPRPLAVKTIFVLCQYFTGNVRKGSMQSLCFPRKHCSITVNFSAKKSAYHTVRRKHENWTSLVNVAKYTNRTSSRQMQHMQKQKHKN